MIKLENFEVVGWEHAIRGMRNPMNSWEKTDSYVSDCQNMDCDECLYGSMLTGDRRICDVPTGSPYMFAEVPHLGPNDKSLMMKLRNAGTDHRKFMRMIAVYVDITAPLYWWKEFDTYKVGTVANSCSTMHKIPEKEFTLEDFSCEHLIGGDYDFDADEPIDIDNFEFESTGLVLASNDDNGWLTQCYHTARGDRCIEYLSPKNLLETYIIEALNANREAYLKTKDKKYWWQMIQLLPSSYNQRRTVMMNYENLANMYKSRKNHKLDEWREFCEWVEKLPYSEVITGEAAE